MLRFYSMLSGFIKKDSETSTNGFRWSVSISGMSEIKSVFVDSVVCDRIHRHLTWIPKCTS